MPDFSDGNNIVVAGGAATDTSALAPKASPAFTGLVHVATSDGDFSKGVLVADAASLYATYQGPSSLEGVTVDNTGYNPVFAGGLWLNYYSSGNVTIGKSGASAGTGNLVVINDLVLTAGKTINWGTANGGLKIGTATTQRLGFWNTTPVVQPANTSDLKTVLTSTGLLASGGTTPLNLGAGTLTTSSLSVTGGTISGITAFTTSNLTVNTNAATFNAGLSTTNVFTTGINAPGNGSGYSMLGSITNPYYAIRVADYAGYPAVGFFGTTPVESPQVAKLTGTPSTATVAAKLNELLDALANSTGIGLINGPTSYTY